MTQPPNYHHILGVTPEDKSATQTLDIQIEIEPLPHGQFRGAEGIKLDWQQLDPFMWAGLVHLSQRELLVLRSLALDLTIEQPFNEDGDATGEITVLKASITNDKDTRELETDEQLIQYILGDPCIIEAIWAAAEEKHRVG